MMRRAFLVLAVCGGLVSLGGVSRGSAALEVLVTNAGDSVVAGESECPSATKCTLRRAIELVNADTSEGVYTIRFDPAVFDPGEPAAIFVLEIPLPVITRADVTLDASDAGVHVDGSQMEGAADGIVAVGARAIIRGLDIRSFSGSCLALAGDDGLASGNTLGACASGILVTGARASVRGNTIGFAADGAAAAPVAIGIVVSAPGARVGDAAGGPSAANIIGNAGTGIRAGDFPGPEFDDVEVAGNIIGKAPASGSAAPVGTGVEVRPPAQRVRVLGNAVANAGAGIVVAAAVAEVESVQNRLSANRFEAIGGMSIDLGGNGLRESNDAGDADAGPNTLLNHPVITRAVQSRIQGTACAGCRVELYHAAHAPGGDKDFATTPVTGGVVTVDNAGLFELNSPPLVPGQWIMALAIDPTGNTSEFGPSARVGTGIAQCGNVALGPGWNLSGFFGTASLPLGDIFPPEGPSTVGAIFHLVDGSLSYPAWFANGTAGRTLHTLESGEAYWFHATATTTITGGFSLSVPLPVALKAGWNEFVYIGASVDVADALASIAGKWTSVYRWSNTEGEGRWRSHHWTLPAWTQGLTTLDPCGAYSIFVTEDVTLSPPQP